MKNVPLSLCIAATGAGLTLLRPADWSPGVRRAYVFVPGAALGAIGVLAVRKGAEKGRERAAGTVDLVTPFTAGAGAGGSEAAPGTGSPTVPSYIAAGTAGGQGRIAAVALMGLATMIGVTVSGVLAATMVLDERIETWLIRRGVVHPRRVMAAAAALWSLAVDVVMDAKEAKDSKPRQ